MPRNIRATPTSLQICREDNPGVFSRNGVCRTQDESSLETSVIPDVWNVIFFHFNKASDGASLILLSSVTDANAKFSKLQPAVGGGQ